MRKTILALLILAFCVPLRADDPPSTAPAAESKAPEPTFTGKALDIKKKMDGLFDQSKNVNHLEAKKRTEARNAIDTALDWDQISEDAVGSGAWKKVAAGNRSSFRDLLKDVIVRTAYTRLDKFWEGGTTTSYDKIDVQGSKALVSAKFFLKGEPFSLDYYFHSKGSKWLIYDISFEGERYSVNINEQIAAFLNEKPFAALLEKLKKRRAELMEDAPKPKKKG